MAVLCLEGGVAVASGEQGLELGLALLFALRFPLLLRFLGLFAFEIHADDGLSLDGPPYLGYVQGGASDQQEAKHQESGESQPFHHVQRNFIGVGLFVP